MKTLQDYILGIKKEHHIKIRFLDLEMDDKSMDRLENHLKKYELIDIKAPVRTIFQKNPIGFTGPVSGEVTIVDAVVGVPVDKYIMELDIAQMFRIPRNYICVQNEMDELLTTQYEDEKENYVTKVSTDPAYPEDKDRPDNSEFYGDEYNKEMIKTVTDARKEAKKIITKTAEE